VAEKRHREHGEGSVFIRKLARKDGTTRVRYGFSFTTPEGRRIQRLFETKAERDRELLSLRTGTKSALAGDIKLEPYLKAWLEKVAKGRVKDSTYDHYAHYVEKHLIPGLGHVRLDKLSPAQVQSFMSTKLAGGVSPRTVNHMRRILGNALNSAIKWGLLNRNAAELADPPKIPKAKRQKLDTADALALLEAIRGHRYEALIVLTLVTGLRQGEILGTCWEDLDLELGILYLHHQLQLREGKYQLVDVKTDAEEAERPMALPEQVIDLLSKRRAEQAKEREEAGGSWERWKVGDRSFEWPLVFTTELGRPLNRHVVTHTFQKILAQAELPHMRFHDLRGSTATFLAALGVHPRVAQEYLGHADMGTTMRYYTDVLPESRRDASERLAGLLWGQRSGNHGAGSDAGEH
jgi:integrase